MKEVPSKYSKAAIDFQKSIRSSAIFRVFNYPEHLPLRGETLVIRDTLLMPKNPDDHLYECEDEKGARHEIRGWWLRLNSARVD